MTSMLGGGVALMSFGALVPGGDYHFNAEDLEPPL